MFPEDGRLDQLSVTTSGGVNVDAEDVSIAGDVVGRDKILSDTDNFYFGGDFATLDDLYVCSDAVFQCVQL
jgi:hypothetical protein